LLCERVVVLPQIVFVVIVDFGSGTILFLMVVVVSAIVSLLLLSYSSTFFFCFLSRSTDRVLVQLRSLVGGRCHYDSRLIIVMMMILVLMLMRVLVLIIVMLLLLLLLRVGKERSCSRRNGAIAWRQQR